LPGIEFCNSKTCHELTLACVDLPGIEFCTGLLLVQRK
jgi:hypothetical protein